MKDEIKRQPLLNKAAFLHGPSDIRVREVPVNDLRLGEVLVRIKAATTCGTDIKSFKRGGHPQIIKTLPSPFGHEMSGTIVETAEDIFNFEKDDRVVIANSAPCHDCFYCKRELFNLCEDIAFINGAYAQYIVVPPRFVKYNLHKFPENLSFEKASLSEPLACVLYACEKVNVQEGETVALIGDGPMSFLFLQVVLAKGGIPIMIGRHTEKLMMAKGAGAKMTVNAKNLDAVAEILKMTEGYGVDVAIEAVGKTETWQQAVNMVHRGGRVLFYGGCAKGTQVELDTYRVHYEEITMMGVFHYTPKVMQKAIQLLAEGEINTDLFLKEKRTLEDLSNIYMGRETVKPLKFLIKP